MKVIDPGHWYILDSLDGGEPQPLVFVKRDQPPEKYPGNDCHYAGTNLQEPLRACIDRLEYLLHQAEYVDDYESVEDDKDCISLLRGVFLILEKRAARQHGRELQTRDDLIDRMPYCKTCGHVECSQH